MSQTPGVDLLGTWVALLLTLFIFSSLWRSNLLSQLAEHLLVGTAAGYAGVVAVRQVLRPRLLEPLLSDLASNWHLLIPALLALFWIVGYPIRERRVRQLGDLGLALLVGTGAGLVVGGTWQGTLWPQALAATDVRWDVSMLVLLVGTVSVPLFLQLRALRERWDRTPPRGASQRLGRRLMRFAGAVGQVFLLVALGVIFARAATARLSLLIARLQFVIDAVAEVGLLAWAERIWDILGGAF